ncbi:hypothetical protein [Sphingomonas solaris]|uniref:Uncharacterized protein n=1 Tax=Alterirhizorhabdus solaris TaxID=2529389 RepID=A0A558R4Y9_9SPHN|nr:hypothetical protein [Sphingomonas solaris]TVV74451.1 hypothetical protein FOY91_09730 [Sphingomonas solaris]
MRPNARWCCSKNDGNALPLVAGAQKRVAVIGAMADSPGDTTVSLAFPQDAAKAVTIFKGISERLNGVQFSRLVQSPLAGLRGPAKLWTPAQTADELKKAVDLARRSEPGDPAGRSRGRSTQRCSLG